MITFFDYCASPLGELLLTSDQTHLTGLYMRDHQILACKNWQLASAVEPIEMAIAQLHSYFAGELTQFDLPIRSAGTVFQRSVWHELRKIEYGSVISYAELAARIGNHNACRAVGLANGRNPISIIIPCHRVVGSDGRLTGYGGGIWRKARLLELEQSVSTTKRLSSNLVLNAV